MKYSFWPPDMSYPIYINPTDKEIIELAESGWDTIRVCVDTDIIAVASGLGNTHQSVINAVRINTGLKRWHPVTYIIFKFGGDIYFNLEDVSGERAAPWNRVLKEYFSDAHASLLETLITNS